MESGWNVWLWLVGVVSGCGWQEVGVANKVKSMDDNCGEWVECIASEIFHMIIFLLNFYANISVSISNNFKCL